jgi:hypothetical protein
MIEYKLGRLVFLGGLLACGATAIQPAESAPLRLRVEDVGGAIGAVVTDNAAGDANPLLGSILFIAAGLGGFSIAVNVGISNSPGGPASSNLAFTNTTVSTVAAGTFRITVEDDVYTFPADRLQGTVSGSLSAPPGSAVTVNSWVNLANAVPALGADQGVGPIGAIGAIPAGSIDVFGLGGVTFGPGALLATETVAFPEDASYSLFAQATVTLTGPGTVTFLDAQQALPPPQALPEPATWLLMLLGLAMVPLVPRRNR